MSSRPFISLVVTAASVLVTGVARGEPLPAEPQSLRECYLRVAMGKSTADMAYVAREICDALFKPERRSLFVLDAKGGPCVEWWFDQRGRYETPAIHCALEATGTDTWSLACQYKDPQARFGIVELAEKGGVYQRTGNVVGVDPGRIFKTLTQCLRVRAGL